jgi:hypothetical protein
LGLLPSSYFAFFVAFSAWSFHDDVKSNVSRTRIVAEALSDAGLLVVALSYWLPLVRTLLGASAPFVFSVALAAFLVQVVAALRRQFPGADFSPRENIAVGSIGTILVAVTSAPLVYWGFSAAVLHLYAGT